jgi:phosphomannomutase
VELNPGIFKAYDIRGVYGEELDEGVAYDIGRSFVRVLAGLREIQARELRIGLGRDMRLTSPKMAAEVRDGIIAEGAKVVDAGMVATEMLYHLVGSRDLDGGAMVTASHNPKKYTGVKLVREGALPLSGDAGIAEVRATIEAGLGDSPGGGQLEEVDIWDEYRAHALGFIDPDAVKPMKVVVDGGNGMGGPMIGPILEKLPLELE